jgi:hypothetical protein
MGIEQFHTLKIQPDNVSDKHGIYPLFCAVPFGYTQHIVLFLLQAVWHQCDKRDIYEYITNSLLTSETLNGYKN